MKPRPPRPPRKDPGPLRKQPVRKQSMPKATNTSAETRAKVADLKKQIKKLMGQYK
jgi:hypothetical protein